MPTFGILPDKELEAIVSYVIHLSLRGEVELYTMRTLAQDPSAEVEETVVEALGTIGNKFWAEAQNLTIDPDPYKATGDPERVEAVKRGFELFNKAGCLSCHINYGRNDRYLYDIWGTIVRPANLTTGIFRGGRRPIDLYFRVHGGINGSKMPAVNDEVKQAKQIWDIVEFLQALPHKAMLPDKVRGDIYGSEQ